MFTSRCVRSRPTWSIPPVSCQTVARARGRVSVARGHRCQGQRAREGIGTLTMPKKQAAHRTTYHGKACTLNP